MELFLSLSVICVSILVFIHLQNEKQNKFNTGMFDAMERLMKGTAETVASMQIEHFRDLEKTSDRQLKLMENHFTGFMKHLKDTEELLISGNINNYYGAKNPQQAKDLITSAVENTIEEKETDEIPITDDMRVPIIDGVKVKFEDEEEILSPSIFPITSV